MGWGEGTLITLAWLMYSRPETNVSHREEVTGGPFSLQMSFSTCKVEVRVRDRD